MVHWLRIHFSAQGMNVQSQVREIRFPHASLLLSDAPSEAHLLPWRPNTDQKEKDAKQTNLLLSSLQLLTQTSK